MIHKHPDPPEEVSRFEHVEAFIPDGCVPIASVAVVEYLDEDGKTVYGIEHHGDVPLSSFLGLLEMAKLDMFNDAKATWGGE